MDNNGLYVHSLAERVAILETQMSELTEIRKKLDELLQLKAQGMGAISLVSVLIGSGVLGVIATIFTLFNKQVPHL